MVRRATASDALGIAAIHVRSWQAAYRGLLDDELLNSLTVAEREQRWREHLSEAEGHWLTLVAAHADGTLLGFCSVATPCPGTGAGGGTAEVGALYVDPEHWRQGVGWTLLSVAFEELERGDWRDVTLWVLPENHAARSFYARFGFEVQEGIEKREERSGRSVIQMRASLPRASSTRRSRRSAR
jgi:ribosomal protein S18 acetylase RimI-like enzyme